MRTLTTIIILAFTIFLSSCGLLRETDFSLIQIGMTTAEVKQNIGTPARVVAAKRYDDGILEIYEYPRLKAQPDTMLNWLLFIDNRLEEWGPKEQYLPSEYDRYYHKYRKNRR
ncbi:hypothetical protein [Sphingobacterium bovistauri]|uniref:Beta-barrel assembly machine subunit BamE n=1 Tax=Sphingobacterium bovistauri TaxID=2781959 RepID=A0ABS7Z8R1_9SPHI|nr:hypothetical protein [Sphingobacterium bovistauri]MCA5006583.1 hypothetical protein [Sphingobacterium bovistauri]